VDLGAQAAAGSAEAMVAGFVVAVVSFPGLDPDGAGSQVEYGRPVPAW
jgi:hypothetical protein